MTGSPGVDVVTRPAESQRGPAARRRATRWAPFLAGIVLLALGRVVIAAELPTPDRTGPELFGVDSPLGRFDYQLGRGLRLGNSRLTLGGFTTAEVERPEVGETQGG